jgi:translocation and assembly module TamB
MNRNRSWSLKKFLLVGLPTALVLLLTFFVYWLLHTSSGAAWVWSKVEDLAAGTVRSSHVDGDLASGFIIKGLEYRSDEFDLSVAHAEIAAGPGWWPLSIQVQTLALRDVDIVIHSRAEKAEGTSTEMDIRSALAALKLPLSLKVHNAELANISLQQGYEAPHIIIESLGFQATLDERLVVDRLDIVAAGINARLDGNLQLEPPFELLAEVEGRYEVTGDAGATDLILPFKLESSGNLENVQFDFASHENGMQVGGELLQLAISGSASANAVQISSAKISKPGTDLLINIKAYVDINANEVNAQLDWTGFSWPLADATADFLSPSGRSSVNGSLDQWTSTGEAELQLGDYPQGRFEILGAGGRTSARLTIADGAVLGGSVSGEASADWADGLIWDASIRTQGINPEPLLPGWPGQLDAELEINASSQAESLQIKLASMQGQIRGIPINARGGFIITGDNVTFSHVDVRTDKAMLLLDGNATESAGISMKFSGELPAVLLPGASGSIEAEARYSSHPNGQALELQLEALDLAWNDYYIREVSVSTHGAGPVPALQLDALGVGYQDLLLDELSLNFSPEGERHKLRLDLAGQDFTLTTKMTVVPENASEPLNTTWPGTVDELEVGLKQTYILSLSKPAAIKWSPEAVLLGPACLRENGGAGLCLSGEYQTSGDWSLVADTITVPIDYLRDILELDVHFEQLLEGRLEWFQSQNQAATGGAEFRITAGKIIDLDDGELLAETSEGRFAFALQNGNLESGVLDLELPGIGFIDIDFDVLDIIGDGARILKGRAVTQLDDIKLIGQLVLPGVDEIGGRFDSNIQLGGTLTDPVFDGGFKFSNGFFNYAPIGLKLEDVEFEGQVEQRDRGSFKGRFQAGEGTGSIDGSLLFEDIEQPQVDVAFSGDQLLLVNTDALKIQTETDLKFAFSPQRMDINGYIRVPSARLTPSNLLLGVVNDSEDLVIETGGASQESETNKSTRQNRVYGQLEVAFGDDVLIQVPGIETNISGSVLFNWSGDPVPLAQGSYELQGKVDVYGPVLQINSGQISFPDVPADNPLLNIRAERDIYGNTQIRSAGVQVIGTLKRPVLEAYTVPVTNDMSVTASACLRMKMLSVPVMI